MADGTGFSKAGSDSSAGRASNHTLPIVTPLQSFADYEAARLKRHDIAVERSACEKELNKAVTAIARGFAAAKDDAIDKQANDILAGRKEEAFEGFEELQSQVARLTQRSKAYGQALRMQDEIVATIRSDRSLDAEEIVAPAHRDIVREIADCIARLRSAFDHEKAVRAVATQAGYDDRLPSYACGYLLKNGSQLDDIERRAREYVR